VYHLDVDINIAFFWKICIPGRSGICEVQPESGPQRVKSIAQKQREDGL